MSFGGTKKGSQPDPVWRQFVYGGLSGCIAASCTQPIDLIKVRMQLQGTDPKAVKVGLIRTGALFLKQEGFFALYKGLSASLLRQATYTTTRFGLYLKIKDWMAEYTGKSNPSLVMKVAGSMLAGAGGALVGSPADLVLVRMQADGKLPPEKRRNYKNAVDGLVRISRQEGVMALWRGSGPNIQRAMFMTAGQLASYDQAKQSLLQTGYFVDNAVTYVTASFIAAFVATSVTSPFDVVKTRVMNSSVGTYKSALDCFQRTLRAEGPMAFYKGFIPYYLRLGPHTMITLVAYEQLCAWTDRLLGKK